MLEIRKRKAGINFALLAGKWRHHSEFIMSYERVKERQREREWMIG
jgi:hypothetical protein